MTAVAAGGPPAADPRIAPPPPPRAREALKRTRFLGGRLRRLRPLLQLCCFALAGLSSLPADAQTTPTVSGVAITSTPNIGDTYNSNPFWPISVEVSFSEAVTVTGAPQLALTIGAQTRQADYASGSGASTLRFNYSVQFSDVDADGVSIAANALTLNGGTIRSAGGVNASLGLGSHAVSNASGHKVEGRISFTISSRPQDGGDTYSVNEAVFVIVRLGQPVQFSPATPGECGRVRLALTIGSSTRQVEHIFPVCPQTFNAFARQALRFRYEVQSGDVDADGISIAANALTVTGGTLQYDNGAPAHLNFGTHAVANDAGRKVNGGVDIAPRVLSVGDGEGDLIPPVGDTWRRGERIVILVGFGEPISVIGVPRLALTVGSATRQADYLRCRGGVLNAGFCEPITAALEFGYVVQSSDRDADGISIAADALTLNGGAIRDRGSNNAQLDLSAALSGPCPSPFCFLSGNFQHKVDGGIEVPPSGGGAPPPPANERPVAVGEFGDVDLDPGESMEVSLLGKFRDPEGGALAFSAESLNPEVAGAVVSNGRLWVDGRSAGQATVFVTAEDSGGLRARLAFKVRVGRVLSFVRGSASAPEGGTARLGLELNSPSERAVVVGWVLEADGDPLTADADADDHGAPTEGAATFAAGGTEAFIEVPVLDDGDIEPAREFLRVRLLAPDSEADWALGLATALVVVQEGVCDRSAEVRDALRGSRECWAPSVGDLAGRGYLDLRGRGIASLRERDLLGLSGLRVLHLHGNRLAELPEGLFAGLGSLERLRLDGNLLAALPAGLFEGLGRLSSLDLSGNRLSGLPSELLSGAPSLSRLDLSGNRVESLPAGFFEGLSGLAELSLLDNPGAPFTLTMNLARTDAEPWAPGPAAVAARVREGAPFALSAGLAVRGSAELSTETARIGAGEDFRRPHHGCADGGRGGAAVAGRRPRGSGGPVRGRAGRPTPLLSGDSDGGGAGPIAFQASPAPGSGGSGPGGRVPRRCGVP